MRRVAVLVRGLPVDRATAMLRLLPKDAARPLAKVIASATANALAIVGTAHHKTENFVVADVCVDGGPIARRFRPVGMGRAYRIRKRYCHVKVVVSDAAVAAAEAVKARPTSREKKGAEKAAPPDKGKKAEKKS